LLVILKTYPEFIPVPIGQISAQTPPSKYIPVPEGHLSTHVAFLMNDSLNNGEAEQLETQLNVNGS
jgi:hypothetical protein